MGKSTDRNIPTDDEFYKLEQLLNQTADDASTCLKLLKKELSEYDRRNGNHFVNTATTYMRRDMRHAKDTAMDMKHVSHNLNKEHKSSKTDVSSAQNVTHTTAKAFEALEITARNYDKENGQRMGVKGRISAAMGGHHHKDETHAKDEKHPKHGESNEGLLGKHDKESEGGMFGMKKSDEKSEGLVGEVKERSKDVFNTKDENGSGIVGSSETVETIVKRILHDHFNLKALDHQIKAAEKSLSPSIMERAKEKMHDVKEKLVGNKSDSAHDGHGDPHESHPVHERVVSP
ncbi:hypothetical protein CCR75_003222 [Bremia lactucae]|uniref:Uncharacterized protein n=1 Tax=Bremia lactucae TaxID=4779 RepID=A0A976FPD3_BRELC|nr:hypothetical protein CCR75_003222 [Bremia lactucae]